MRIIWPSAGLAAGLLFAAIAPGRAASPVTDAFLANLIPNVDFLDRSSRMALTGAKSRKLRDFAHGEAREQTLAANAVYDWTQARATLMASAASGRLDATPTGSTPRSSEPEPEPAATPIAAAAPTPEADPRLPRGQEDLDSLEGLSGAEFDADFKAKQKDALEQVAADYVDYIAKGDDPTLVDLAKRHLPQVRKRLAALAKL